MKGEEGDGLEGEGERSWRGMESRERERKGKSKMRWFGWFEWRWRDLRGGGRRLDSGGERGEARQG